MFKRMDKIEYLTIGQLAKKSHVKVPTVRYYERRRLMPEPPRRESGYRQYSRDDVLRIQFIKHSQGLGFTLKEIQDLLTLRANPVTTCADVKRRTEAKIADIEEKIQALQRMKQALKKLSITCKGRGPIGECPILDALNSKTFKKSS